LAAVEDVLPRASAARLGAWCQMTRSARTTRRRRRRSSSRRCAGGPADMRG